MSGYLGRLLLGNGDSPEISASEGNFGVMGWSKAFVNNYLRAKIVPLSLKKAV